MPHLVAKEGPYRGLSLNLEKGDEWIIGRDPDASDFVVEDETVSRKHAKIYKTPEGIWLKPLSKVSPTLVNDEEKEEALLLMEGDRIQIGNTLFLYSEKALPKTGEKGGYDNIFGDAVEDEEVAKKPLPERERESVEQGEPEPPSPPKPEMTAYDTIFEDTGEEEAPFNLISEPPLMLKVITGPNAGAEIGLEKGRSYTIGKDPHSCDIVFQDMSVSRHHAKLGINADGIIDIEDLESKNGTAINGILITEKRTVAPQDLVAVGTTVFMIIDAEAPQETIYSSVVQSLESAKEEEVSPLFVENVATKDWKKEPIPMKYLVMVGSAAAIFLIMFISFFSLFKSKGIEIVQKEPVSEIKETLAKFNDVQFSYNPGSGRLFIAGHVLTAVDYQEMRYRLGQIDFILGIEDNVVIDEGVWKMMNDVIGDTPEWRGVSIHSPAAGKFVVSGYLSTVGEGEALSEYLTVNFPYLDRLDNQVVIQEVLDAQISAMITTHNLGAVSAQVANGQVILLGMYGENRKSDYESLIGQLNKVKGVSSVKDFAVATHPNSARVDLSQNFQVSGTSTYDGRGYTVILNGRIYTLGDLIDGMKITSIEPNTILLENNGLKYKVDYRR